MDTPALRTALAAYRDELVAFRRDLHAHPEVGRSEVRTTTRVAERLQAAGLRPRRLPGTGLVCDIGRGPTAVALRADLDALPLTDETGSAFASVNEGVAHACGHDVHTTVVLGAGLLLADAQRAGQLAGRVRLLFQPAEEATPGGALDVVAAGGLDGVREILTVHCDPHADVGQVGLRAGAVTSAADHVLVRLHGDGGHTSRPHLTGDLVFALAEVITALPAILSRRLDPRAVVSLVWGRVMAGGAANAIPRTGVAEGTLRCLDVTAWEQAGALLAEAVADVVRPFGVRAELEHTRGVPPVVNDAASIALLEAATRGELGDAAVVTADQSLGGEDFSWYLQHVPGALARLGTRTPGGPTFDLHRGDFDVDERAISVGVLLLTGAALRGAAGVSGHPATPVGDTEVAEG